MVRHVEIGTWAEIPTVYTVDIMMKAGFDFVIADLEHGIIDFETLQSMVFGAHANSGKAFVRVPSIDESWVLRVADMGCDGIIFPQVSSLEDVCKIKKYALFPPKGHRGFNPYITAGLYSKVSDDYFEKENKRLEIGIILEGKDAFDSIETIVSDQDINIVYIGQYDLSVALGVPGIVDAPIIEDYLKRSVDVIKKNGKKAGCMVHTPTEAEKMIKAGFDFIVYKVDTGILFSAVNRFVKEVRGQ